MTKPSVRVEHLFKKFRRGELHDSLRDLIPAAAARLLPSKRERALEAQEFWALQDISFEVGPGEAFGVIGANGAGKSTLLKLLSRILKPDGGTVSINGRLSALIEIGAGFHPDLTGRENIYLNGTILGLRRADIRRRFDEIIAFSGLEQFIDTPVKRYSSGMYARLGFSVASHVDPDVLLVDEVLSVGDFSFQRRCLDRMRLVLASGTTILFISHNLQAVTSLCPRALFLDKGRQSLLGTSEDAVRMYLGSGRQRRSSERARPVFLSSVRVRGAEGLQTHFRSGESCYVDVEVTALEANERLSVGVAVVNAESVGVFRAATERLIPTPMRIPAGHASTCTFSLELHLGSGTYFVSAWINRQDTQEECDRWEFADTLLVSSDLGAVGIADLHARVVIGQARPVDTKSVRVE